jgi:hypothetical protein
MLYVALLSFFNQTLYIMKKILFFLFLISFSQKNFAQPDYKLIDPFFKKYIDKNGKVDYKSLKSNKKELDATLAFFTKMPPKNEWHRNEKLAYWLNVYNLQVLKIIVENYPCKNILNIHNGKMWQVKCIEIEKRIYCLDEIEHDIIRKELKEPRIHFAFFSGSMSSPILLNEVFTPANMNPNFDLLAKRYINSSVNTIAENKIILSPIFKWYEGDFKDIIAFVNQYSKVKVQEKAEISYANFDWNLKE